MLAYASQFFLGSVHELALTRFIVCLRRQFVHYVINSQPPRFRALLSAYADGLFVNGLEKNKCRFRGACFFRHPLHYKHIYSEMLLDFLSNVMPALCICYCFLLFLYFSLAHIKKLAVFQIYAILDLNVILRKMYQISVRTQSSAPFHNLSRQNPCRPFRLQQFTLSATFLREQYLDTSARSVCLS